MRRQNKVSFMNTMSGSLAEPKAAATGRRTVDAPMRVFHWLLAASFAGAYVTSEMESLRRVHTTLGYTVAGLLVARLLWGLVGPRPARWSTWARRLQPLWQGRVAGWRPALNTLAVIGVLLSAVATVGVGIALDQGWAGERLEDALAELHEGAGNAMLAMVLGHLAMLAFGLWRHGPAQVLAMVTGRMRGAGPDLVRNRAWLGLLVLAGVLTFWTWQWQTRPLDGGGMGWMGAEGAQPRAHAGAAGGDDDDDHAAAPDGAQGAEQDD